MIQRDIAPYIQALATQYPVITITGPRQSGKTTLCKTLFKEKQYINLESLQTREFALSDPIGLIKSIPDGAIIDEIQYAPQLLSEIQVRVDEIKKPGQFILTGSNQLSLSTKISQSLAGRTAVATLLPFTIQEARQMMREKSPFEWLYYGFYPRIYDSKLNPTQALDFYMQTYIERDIRQLSNIHQLSTFQKFVKLCATRVGQLVNLSEIGNEIGISHSTVRDWLTILQASYIIFLLEPFSVNISKRLIKTPKLYFYDVGLAAYLLGIEQVAHVDSHPLKGALFENMIISEKLKNRFNIGKNQNMYFYRDSSGLEIDLIYPDGSKWCVIEIKSSQTINSHFFKNILNFEKLFPEFISEKYLIYAGDQNQKRSNGIQVVSADFCLPK